MSHAAQSLKTEQERRKKKKCRINCSSVSPPADFFFFFLLIYCSAWCFHKITQNKRMLWIILSTLQSYPVISLNLALCYFWGFVTFFSPNMYLPLRSLLRIFRHLFIFLLVPVLPWQCGPKALFYMILNLLLTSPSRFREVSNPHTLAVNVLNLSRKRLLRLRQMCQLTAYGLWRGNREEELCGGLVKSILLNVTLRLVSGPHVFSGRGGFRSVLLTLLLFWLLRARG